MARTKQTARAGSRGGKPATFPPGRVLVSAGGGPALWTASASGAPIPGDQGGKAPHGWAPPRRRVGKRTGRILPALRIARENAASRMMEANVTPQGYYKPSEKQKQFKWKPGTCSLHELPSY